MKIEIKIADQLNGTYKAWCPALPGCAVYGRSKREAKTRIRQAVCGYMEHLSVALPRELASHMKAASRLANGLFARTLPALRKGMRE